MSTSLILRGGSTDTGSNPDSGRCNGNRQPQAKMPGKRPGSEYTLDGGGLCFFLVSLKRPFTVDLDSAGKNRRS